VQGDSTHTIHYTNIL